MGEVVKLERGTLREAVAIPRSMRRPGNGENPASQFVSVGTAVSNLLAKLERDMNERAITVP